MAVLKNQGVYSEQAGQAWLGSQFSRDELETKGVYGCSEKCSLIKIMFSSNILPNFTSYLSEKREGKNPCHPK